MLLCSEDLIYAQYLQIVSTMAEDCFEGTVTGIKTRKIDPNSPDYGGREEVTIYFATSVRMYKAIVSNGLEKLLFQPTHIASHNATEPSSSRPFVAIRK